MNNVFSSDDKQDAIPFDNVSKYFYKTIGFYLSEMSIKIDYSDEKVETIKYRSF